MKRLKVVAASVMACVSLFSYTGCSSFKVIDNEDVFFNALTDVAGIKKKETIHEKNYEVNGDDVEYFIYTGDGDNFYTYIRFEEDDDAMDYFDIFYQDFEEIKEDEEFDGSSSMSEGKTRGMVTFNGEVGKDNGLNFYHMNKHFFEDTEIYGGVYVNKNVYIEVYSADGSKRDKEKIDKFLKQLGFPKP